eukprot:g27819.t1
MAHGKITVQFNRSLLGSDRLIVQDYKTLGSSRVEVLTNKSLFCLQTSGRKDEECIDDGSGKGAGTGAFEDEKTWDKRSMLALFELFQRLSSGSVTPLELTEASPLDVFVHQLEDGTWGLFCSSRQRLLAFIMRQACSSTGAGVNRRATETSSCACAVRSDPRKILDIGPGIGIASTMAMMDAP